LYFLKDENYVHDFLETLQKVARAINMQIQKPQKNALRDDRTETYLRELQSIINDNLELVVIVFPTNRTDRYSAIKK